MINQTIDQTNCGDEIEQTGRLLFIGGALLFLPSDFSSPLPSALHSLAETRKMVSYFRYANPILNRIGLKLLILILFFFSFFGYWDIWKKIEDFFFILPVGWKLGLNCHKIINLIIIIKLSFKLIFFKAKSLQGWPALDRNKHSPAGAWSGPK